MHTPIKLIGKEEQELPSEITILYKNNQVPRLTLTKFWIWNDGTETINGDQIVKDDQIMLSFAESDQILSANVAAFTRAVNKVRVLIDPIQTNKCFISFDYLDSKDGARIELLHTSKIRYPKISGTIRGIPRGLKSLTATNRSKFKRFSMLIFRQRSYAYKIAFVLGSLAVIIGLLPDTWLSNLNSFTNSSKGDEKSFSSIKIAFIIVGFLYIIFSASGFLSSRRRYPQSLDESDTELKTKGIKS